MYFPENCSNLTLGTVLPVGAATRGVLYKKAILKILQNSQENTCTRVFFKKETVGQVLFCTFCAFFTNTSFTEHVRATTTVPGRRSNFSKLIA